MGGWDSDEPEPESQRIAARNIATQIRRAVELIEQAIAVREVRITAELICELHALAMRDLVEQPGVLRSRPEEDPRISGAAHAPPTSEQVASLVDEACETVNSSEMDAVATAAFILWRLNWIHPFAPDGNGRTARAVAFIHLHRTAMAEQLAPSHWLCFTAG